MTTNALTPQLRVEPERGAMPVGGRRVEAWLAREWDLRGVGAVLVLIALVCNEKLLAPLLRPDGLLMLPTRFRIASFEILALATGLLLLWLRRVTPRAALAGVPRPVQVLLANVVVFALLLGTVGLAFLVVLRQTKPRVDVRFDFMRHEPILGSRPKPGVIGHHIRLWNGQTHFVVSYAFDQWSRRRTPRPPDATRFALFFGCSVTFGWALAEDETLPAQFGRLAPRYAPYNYACPGYGPQQTLARLQDGRIRTELPESKGVGFYVFIDDHVRRAIGSSIAYNYFAAEHPYYVEEGPRLVRKGSFWNGRPVTSFFYSLLGALPALEHLGIDLPPDRIEHVRLTARILEESRNEFRRLFPESRFVVVFFPGCTRTPWITPYLRRAGVEYIDYSNLWPDDPPGMRIDKGDNHPTAAAVRAVAEQLARDL